MCVCTTCSFDLASRFPTACMGQIPACWCKDGSSFRETGANKFPGLFPGFPFGIGIWKVLRVTALEINSTKAFCTGLIPPSSKGENWVLSQKQWKPEHELCWEVHSCSLVFFWLCSERRQALCPCNAPKPMGLLICSPTHLCFKLCVSAGLRSSHSLFCNEPS